MDRYRDKEWLHEKYIIEGWSTTDIGKFCDVSHKTVCKWMKKLGVPTRDPQSCQLTLSKQYKRESRPNAIKDYITSGKASIQQMNEGRPSLKWEKERKVK